MITVILTNRLNSLPKNELVKVSHLSLMLKASVPQRQNVENVDNCRCQQ